MQMKVLRYYLSIKLIHEVDGNRAEPFQRSWQHDIPIERKKNDERNLSGRQPELEDEAITARNSPNLKSTKITRPDYDEGSVI
ncbi:hypothetical protein AVEN_157058-1 [Araneus ventricosus]|uniref:Uncharacterized protein n=1 Tax=Araneus ventricosus TaxID=182803 RepID=A0A4Y2TC35_ARAVE|nr:hypothetical protein AVEN_229854-1 [Araneus ventricosus]GBN97811.1 hypothetical protein AVEN_157058-1 [Araneus ventricosus]